MWGQLLNGPLAGICGYEHNSEARMKCLDEDVESSFIETELRTQLFTFSQVLITQE